MQNSEQIQVLVKFNGTKVQPLAFRRAGRDYKIESLNLVHHHREGTETIFNFHVTANGNYFNLRFEPETLSWFLEAN
jgi:hypothetical protein